MCLTDNTSDFFGDCDEYSREISVAMLRVSCKLLDAEHSNKGDV